MEYRKEIAQKVNQLEREGCLKYMSLQQNGDKVTVFVYGTWLFDECLIHVTRNDWEKDPNKAVIDSIVNYLSSKGETKDVVVRLTAVLHVTDEEADALMSGSSSDKDARSAIGTIISERRFDIAGENVLDSYIPADCVNIFNETYGTSFDVTDIDLLIPATKGDSNA